MGGIGPKSGVVLSVVLIVEEIEPCCSCLFVLYFLILTGVPWRLCDVLQHHFFRMAQCTSEMAPIYKVLAQYFSRILSATGVLQMVYTLFIESIHALIS